MVVVDEPKLPKIMLYICNDAIFVQLNEFNWSCVLHRAKAFLLFRIYFTMWKSDYLFTEQSEKFHTKNYPTHNFWSEIDT